MTNSCWQLYVLTPCTDEISRISNLFHHKKHKMNCRFEEKDYEQKLSHKRNLCDAVLSLHTFCQTKHETYGESLRVRILMYIILSCSDDPKIDPWLVILFLATGILFKIMQILEITINQILNLTRFLPKFRKMPLIKYHIGHQWCHMV